MSRPRNPTRFLAGLTIWSALGLGVVSLALARSNELGPPTERVVRYAFRSPPRLEVRVEAEWDDNQKSWFLPCAGDPILSADDRTFLGCVEEVRPETASVATPVAVCRIELDPEYDAADLEGARFNFATSSGDPAWIIETLLPPKKRELVRTELAAYVGSHSQEIAALLRPIEEQVLEHAKHVLDANLTPTLKKHEKEIDALLDRYRGQLKDDLLPVLKKELGPTAKEKAKPILTKIGRECWDALPMWEGSWAYLRGKLPFTRTNYIDEWWQDFLENKAVPILKEHEDELVKAGEDLVKQAFKDPEVRKAMNDAVARLAKDPEFRTLARTIIEEALIRPFDPMTLWAQIAADPANKEHFAALEKSLAPVLRRIVRSVAVEMRPDGREGLSPEVARVLRRTVLNKDSRWVSVAPLRPIRPLTAAAPRN